MRCERSSAVCLTAVIMHSRCRNSGMMMRGCVSQAGGNLIWHVAVRWDCAPLTRIHGVVESNHDTGSAQGSYATVTALKCDALLSSLERLALTASLCTLFHYRQHLDPHSHERDSLASRLRRHAVGLAKTLTDCCQRQRPRSQFLDYERGTTRHTAIGPDSGRGQGPGQGLQLCSYRSARARQRCLHGASPLAVGSTL